MEGYRILEIKKSVFENNDREADLLREQLKKDRTFLLNLMSSPGSGKTTIMAWPESDYRRAEGRVPHRRHGGRH